MKKKLDEAAKVFNLDTGEELDIKQILDDLDDDDSEENPFTRAEFDDSEFDQDASLDDLDTSEFGYDELEGELDDDTMEPTLSFGNDEPEFDQEEEGDLEGEEGLGDEEGEPEYEDSEEVEDPDYQGMIRTVKGAYLIYKRRTPEGDFEELWIYNVGKDIRQETTIRRAILAGTDIDPGRQKSEDGTQQASATTAGNVQFLKISGLPN